MYTHLTIKARRVFLTAQEFLDACIKYFEWCVDTPIQDEQVFQYKGGVVRADKAKVRAFTKSGLAQYLSIPASRMEGYKLLGDDWIEAIELIEQAIYNQKFENAAAGTLNSTIISRDLGLAEKTELGGILGAPPVSFNITPIASGTFLNPDEKTAESDEV